MASKVMRGGTSLSGALPLATALLGMAKFSRIKDIDFDNRVAVVEPGVTNLAVSNAVAHAGFYYAPDPSSQIACTIGGNVAENSGGVHCLKYGMTTNNVLGCEMVLMTGEIVRLAKDTVRRIYDEAAAAESGDHRKAIAHHATRSESKHRRSATACR
jgi:FAD/FMN-containing dehydrogenase